MEFIQQNILLVAVAVVSGSMLLASFRRSADDLSPTDATLLINREDALVIDVRSPSEFAAGHIPEARNLPADKFDERLADFAKYKDRPVILNCQSGMRSGGACGKFRKQGFARVYNLAGGVGAWQQAGLPLKKGSK